MTCEWLVSAMEAARGASLTPGQDPQNTQPPSSIGLFAAVVVFVLAIDQATKVWAVAALDGRQPITVIPGLIDFRFLRNGGAALGTGSSMTIVLTAVALVVSIVVIRMSARLHDRGWAVGLGLLLGGAVGNLIDRIFREPEVFRGHVVDFIDYGPFVGNVADIALTFAAVVIIWRSWRGVDLDGTRERGDQ